MTGEQVDVQVIVKSLTSNYKRDPSEVAFQYPLPTPAYEVTPREIDPEYVGVQLAFYGKDRRDFVLNMLMSKEFAKRLNLMVGDKLTLKLIKEVNKSEFRLPK